MDEYHLKFDQCVRKADTLHILQTLAKVIGCRVLQRLVDFIVVFWLLKTVSCKSSCVKSVCKISKWVRFSSKVGFP